MVVDNRIYSKILSYTKYSATTAHRVHAVIGTSEQVEEWFDWSDVLIRIMGNTIIGAMIRYDLIEQDIRDPNQIIAFLASHTQEEVGEKVQKSMRNITHLCNCLQILDSATVQDNFHENIILAARFITDMYKRNKNLE